MITTADMRDLSNPNEYLTDNVIGSLLHLYRIKDRVPGVVVLDPQFLSRLEKFGVGYQDDAKYLAVTTELEADGTPWDLIIMPFNIFEHHWVCVVLRKRQLKWTILDSLYGTGTATNTYTRVKKLLDNLLYKWWGNLEDPRWTYQVSTCSRQTDGSNCALHVVENIRHFQKYEEPDLNPIDGRALRQSYLTAIRVHGQLLPTR